MRSLAVAALVALAVGACRTHQSAPQANDAISLDALVADRSWVGRNATVRGHLTRADLLTSGAARVRVVWMGDADSPLDRLVGRDVQIEGTVGVSYAVLQPTATDGAFREAQDLELRASSARGE